MSFRRGDVVVVSLRTAEGSEQRGTRPCVIVQNDVANRSGATTMVVPITKRANVPADLLPVHVLIKREEGGLQFESVADCGQVVTVSFRSLQSTQGSLSHRTMADIDQKLKVALALR